MNKKAPLRWLFAVAGAILIASVGLGLTIAVWKNPLRGTTLIEVLRLFLSWPFVILSLGMVFGVTFRREISQFLLNIGTIRFPGGTEIRANQPPPPLGENPDAMPPKADTDSITLNEEQQQEKEQILQAANDLLAQKQGEIIYWRFSYLSVFLVPMTQWVLRWFASQGIPPTKEFYEEYWKALVPDPKQRETMLMVLLYHKLLEPNGLVLQVTQAGRDFLSFVVGQSPLSRS